MIAIIGGLGYLKFVNQSAQNGITTQTPINDQPQTEVNSFDECVAAGNPVMESFPRQCRANDQTFTEDIGNVLEKIDLITINNPRPNQKISSPLEIEGEARGTWFFEATFPFELRDANGDLIAESFAQAEGEWMTEEFVPYSATLDFEIPDTEVGVLVLKRSNPSGLPENDDELQIPVKF